LEYLAAKGTSSDIGSQAAKGMLQWTQRRMEISCKDCMQNKEFNAQNYLENIRRAGFTGTSGRQ